MAERCAKDIEDRACGGAESEKGIGILTGMNWSAGQIRQLSKDLQEIKKIGEIDG